METQKAYEIVERVRLAVGANSIDEIDIDLIDSEIDLATSMIVHAEGFETALLSSLFGSSMLGVSEFLGRVRAYRELLGTARVALFFLEREAV